MIEGRWYIDLYSNGWDFVDFIKSEDKRIKIYLPPHERESGEI